MNQFYFPFKDTLYCNIFLTIKHKFNDPLVSLFDIITIIVFMLIEGYFHIVEEWTFLAVVW